jgi:hypothetical protein
MDMLDVAIGVVFVYLLMSLIATAAAEAFEWAMRYRAKDLERGLRELLRDPQLIQQLYDHPLVNGLYVGEYATTKKRNLPSYMPARSFALAVMDLLLSDPNDAKSHDGAASATMAKGLPTTVVSAPSTMQARVAGLQAKIGVTSKAMGAAPVDAKVDQARHAVITLVKAAEHDAEQARKNIEEWFNTAMDRVSGWYKRRTQLVLFLIGITASIAFNADSVRLLRELSTDKGKRDAIVGVATNYAKSTTALPATSTSFDDARTQMEVAQKQLSTLGVPLGWWRDGTPNYGCRCVSCGPTLQQKLMNPEWLRCWFLVFCGWLMTALAISLGAPFWFDTLNKIIVVRSTVKPAEKSGNEASKDAKT